MAQLQIDVSVTNGSAEVTIPGALVAAEIDEGDLFKVYSQNGGQGIYHVGSVAESGGDTIVQLTAPYQGATATGVTGIFHRDFTAEQGYPLMSDGDLDAAAILSRMTAEVDDDFQGVLYDSVLAQNGGTVPEVDQTSDWTSTLRFPDTNEHFRFEPDPNSRSILLNTIDASTLTTGINWGEGTSRLLQFRGGGSSGDNDLFGVAFTRFDSALLLGIDYNEGVATGDVQFMGRGSLNAEELYENGNRVVTDYVFDAELDGDIDTAHYDALMWEREIDEGEDEGGKPKVRREKQTHRPAHAFRENTSELEPTEFAKRWRQSRKLPAMERCESSLREGQDRPSLGQTLQAVLETCEVQAVHIDRLEKRIKQLESDRAGKAVK